MLGVEVAVNQRIGTIISDHRKHINKVVKRFGEEKPKKLTKTPMALEPLGLLNGEDDPKLMTVKREMQGSLLYCQITRKDIILALKLWSQSRATVDSVIGLKRIVKYLRDNPKVLVFRRAGCRSNIDGRSHIVVSAWADSNWGSVYAKYSTTGLIVNVCGNVVLARSLSQKSLATSITEGEIYGLTEGGKQALRVFDLVVELLRELKTSNTSVEKPIPIAGDNSASLRFGEQARSSNCSRLKHIRIRDGYIKDLVSQGICRLVKVAGEDNKSNGLTKICDGPQLEAFMRLNKIVDVKEVPEYAAIKP